MSSVGLSDTFFFEVVRDQDGFVYFRENNGKLLAGGFEPVAKPAFEDGRIPSKFSFARNGYIC